MLVYLVMASWICLGIVVAGLALWGTRDPGDPIVEMAKRDRERERREREEQPTPPPFC